MSTTSNNDIQADEQPHWYVAIVANNTELSTMKKLQERGTGFPAEGIAEYSVPLRNAEVVNCRGKIVTKEKPAIPGVMFVRTTNHVRYNLTRFPNIKKWMMSMDYSPDGRHKFAIVSDAAMTEFLDMVEKLYGNYTIGNISEKVGKRVRFTHGPFKGMEGI